MQEDSDGVKFGKLGAVFHYIQLPVTGVGSRETSPEREQRFEVDSKIHTGRTGRASVLR